MASKQNRSIQTVWAILLLAMGLGLAIKNIQHPPQSGFLSFSLYFIAAVLILGGVKKLYMLFFPGTRDRSQEQ